MKKVIIILVLLTLATPVYARSSGQSRAANAYHITYQVGGTVTFTPPAASMDITIINGDSSNAIWVDLDAGTLPGTIGTEGAFVLPAGKETKLENFMAESITLYPYTQTASPVSVIATY